MTDVAQAVFTAVLSAVLVLAVQQGAAWAARTCFRCWHPIVDHYSVLGRGRCKVGACGRCAA